METLTLLLVSASLIGQTMTEDIDLDGYELKDTGTANPMELVPYSGDITLSDGSGDFGLLKFGGSGSGFPSLKRWNDTLYVRNAADTGNASIYALTFHSNFSFYAGSIGNGFKVSSGPELIGTADGVWTMYNDAQTGFTRLGFGGTGTSSPALTVNGPDLDITKADGTGYADMDLGGIEVINDSADGDLWNERTFLPAEMTTMPNQLPENLPTLEINNGVPSWRIHGIGINHKLYFCAHLSADWDGESDLVAVVHTHLDEDENDNDKLVANFGAHSFGDHDNIDERIPAIANLYGYYLFHNIGTDSAEFSTHDITFIVDHDDPDEGLYPDTDVCFNAGGANMAHSGYVGPFNVTGITIKYRTKYPREKVGTFPASQ